METNKNLNDKTWNNQQKINEGFSSENLPETYNDENPLMTTEIEIDQFGHETEVKRARFPHKHDEKNVFDEPQTANDSGGNSVIENQKSLENRDRNYDIATNRYPYSNPESHRDRGNMKLDQ